MFGGKMGGTSGSTNVLTKRGQIAKLARGLPSFVKTFVEPDVPAIFPPNKPVFRCSLPSTGSLGLVPPFPRCRVGGGALYALATVRRSNCTCGFPAYSFHEDSVP